MVTTKPKIKDTKTKSVASIPQKRKGASPKRVLARAQGEQCFWAHDGQILADLVEFKNALAHMSEETFKHHANASRNDFADWIGCILGDTELAMKIRKANAKGKAQTVVVARLKVYGLS